MALSMMKTSSPNKADEWERVLERLELKRRLVLRRLRQAEAWAQRLKVLPDGRRVFLRFDPVLRYQHFVFMLAFTALAITGLLQHFSHHLWVARVVNVLGGMEALRVVHRVAALISIGVSLHHVAQILHMWVVQRRRGAMWPRWKDFQDLWHTVRYNLGLAPQRPQHDRFSIEEKMEYWALLWGQTLMMVTGLMMWFPVLVTRWLPGEAIPVARALHSWEAILATLAVMVWHGYHVHLKTRNTSIFTGYLTEEEMLEEHPLEYRRIVAAHRRVRRLRRELALIEAQMADVRARLQGPGQPNPAPAPAALREG